jgi:hypothetical protein
MLTGIILLYMDWSQYPDQKPQLPSRPPPAQAGGGGAGARAAVCDRLVRRCPPGGPPAPGNNPPMPPPMPGGNPPEMP